MIFQWNPQSATRLPVPGALSQIAAGGDGSVWGLDSSNDVYRFTPQSSSPPLNSIATLPSPVKQISVGVDGTACALDADDFIYFFERGTRTWQNVPGDLAQISVGSSENVWGVNAGGGIWAWQQNYLPSWIGIPGELKQIAAAANGSVFGINT